ncbi:MAG: phenylalanine--tRNA ligase subunit beta [Prevotellaceae bacterium]|jgi:phenylalanyl-tRNA synthetase beta chain|nr:phenylalanine--tRNA ligase subunit beta [Prevotellaceae bacterium]
MKISYNWLKDYLPVTDTPERVAEVLTSIGLEVEAIERREAVKGGLQGVVVGEVLECAPHPDADKLHVTKVNIGAGEPLQIVCGAPNVVAGQKAPVATIGTTIYFANGDEVKIKKSKLRGVESMGMICAEDELGLGNNHDGIMVLPPEAAPGTPLSEWLALESDTVFEIGLTPNRIDAASHIGVARDLAAALNMDLRIMENGRTPPKTFSTLHAPSSSAVAPVRVTVENPAACPRYTGLTVCGITVQPSPEWMQKRLAAIGVRPINNVVDITNYVLHETGQPLHAFDADTVEGGEVIVKTCPEGTKFVTLDGVERTLSAQDLMICHSRRPMCIAGIFGGLENGVTEKTKNIFLESAYFHPVWIRKTARRHGLNTDASFRYERGADPQIPPYALKRAAQLIRELAGGDIAGEPVDIYPSPLSPAVVQLDYARMERLIGKKIDRETLLRILQRLDFIIDGKDNDGCRVTVPAYRVDVTRECDVVEEILRIYGYNNVEIPARTTVTLSHAARPDKEKIQDAVSDYLVANGFYEMMNNSLTKADYYRSLKTFPGEKAVRILNPLSNDLNVLRQTLLFGGLESIAHNINRQHADLKLFEWGHCYAFDDARNDGSLKAYAETLQLGLFLTGYTARQSWRQPQERSDFFYLKGYVESLLERFGAAIDRLDTDEAPADIFSGGLQYLLNGKVVAVLGAVAKKIRQPFDIKQEVFAAEIAGSLLFKAAKSHKAQYAELPKFPEVRRDLALVVEEKITYAQLRDTAFRTEKNLLTRVNLFDLYRGDKLPQGKKQYALSFVLQDKEKTLSDPHIERIMDNLLKAFEQNFAATLR